MTVRFIAFIKNAWAKDLALVVSFTIWGLVITLPTVRPYTKYATMISQAAPYTSPVLLLDAENLITGSANPKTPMAQSWNDRR